MGFDILRSKLSTCTDFTTVLMMSMHDITKFQLEALTKLYNSNAIAEHTSIADFRIFSFNYE